MIQIPGENSMAHNGNLVDLGFEPTRLMNLTLKQHQCVWTLLTTDSLLTFMSWKKKKKKNGDWNPLQQLTIEYFKLIKLSAGLKVFNSEGDVVARLHFHYPGAWLKVGKAVAWGLTQNHSCRGCKDLIHWTHHCEEQKEKVRLFICAHKNILWACKVCRVTDADQQWCLDHRG